MISVKPNMIVIANVLTDFNCIFQFKNTQKKSPFFFLSLPPLVTQGERGEGVIKIIDLKLIIGSLEGAVFIYRWLD